MLTSCMQACASIASVDTSLSCVLVGEIVETVGFEAENTYIFYDTFLPEGWTFEEANE